eukprot:5474366-Lingulodinium_polyedra.AAC.1
MLRPGLLGQRGQPRPDEPNLHGLLPWSRPRGCPWAGRSLQLEGCNMRNKEFCTLCNHGLDFQSIKHRPKLT